MYDQFHLGLQSSTQRPTHDVRAVKAYRVYVFLQFCEQTESHGDDAQSSCGK